MVIRVYNKVYYIISVLPVRDLHQFVYKDCMLYICNRYLHMWLLMDDTVRAIPFQGKKLTIAESTNKYTFYTNKPNTPASHYFN